MATSSPGPYVSHFLFLVDCTSGLYFLMDTVAEVSILPPSAAERENRYEHSLHAVSNSALPTFGECVLQLDLGLLAHFCVGLTVRVVGLAS